MTEQYEEQYDDGEIEKALTDYHEGMRLGDGVRAAGGMRRLQCLDGSNLERLVLMFRKDANLSKFDLYFLKFDEPQQSKVGSVPHMVNKTLFTALAKCLSEEFLNHMNHL